MSVRQSSTLAYLVPVGGLTLVVASLLWGIADSTIVADFSATWDPARDATATGQEYVLTAWQFYPLLVIVRLGLEAIVTARGTGASYGRVIASTIGVWFILLVLVSYVTVFPSVVEPLIGIAGDNQATLEAAGFFELVGTFERAFMEWFPGLIAGAIYAGFLVGPIRRDALGGAA